MCHNHEIVSRFEGEERRVNIISNAATWQWVHDYALVAVVAF